MSDPNYERRILDELPTLVEPRKPELHAFVHASVLAICGDCGGGFNVERGACPGCTSKSWHLLHPELVPPGEVSS